VFSLEIYLLEGGSIVRSRGEGQVGLKRGDRIATSPSSGHQHCCVRLVTAKPTFYKVHKDKRTLTVESVSLVVDLYGSRVRLTFADLNHKVTPDPTTSKFPDIGGASDSTHFFNVINGVL
jgi:hypothetical protein